jgi:hypothetical protein
MDDPGSNSGRGNRLSLLQKHPDRLWGPHNLIRNGYRGFSPGVKRPGCEVNHSPPPSTEKRNKWSYTSTPPTFLHAEDKDNFTFDLLGVPFEPQLFCFSSFSSGPPCDFQHCRPASNYVMSCLSDPSSSADIVTMG